MSNTYARAYDRYIKTKRLERQRQALSKLADEAERVLLALRDGSLPQGDYPALMRAIEIAKAALAESEDK